jgi:hypothetical protein
MQKLAPHLYGMLAEFESASEIIQAARKTREAGYKRIDTFTPFPIHGLDAALGVKDVRVAWIIFVSGMLGAIGGFTLQWYVAVIDYPLNTGGRPLLSWPSFIPVTFESGILCAAFGAFIGMLALNGLPRLHHPLFGVPRFESASQDKFFLLIESKDSQFDPQKTRAFLETLNPSSISEVMDEAA